MPASKKPTAGAAATAEAEPSFEEALERLETIVEELEAGSLSLEQSLARYEEGMRLSRRLTQTLDQAEKRIERLVEGEGGGDPTTRTFEQGSGEEGTSEAAADGPAGRGGRGRGDRASEGGEGELPF